MSSIPKIYLDKNNIEDKKIHITSEDYHHLKNVLRLNVGDNIIVCNLEKIDYYCKIVNIDDFIVAEVIEEKLSETEFPFSVSLFQAFAKGDKMETIIQKSTELGVTDIYPVYMDRCVSKPDEKGFNNKLQRYQKIARGASSQSGRGIVPVIHSPLKYSEAVSILKTLDIGFVCYEGENTVPIKNILSNNNTINSIGFLIGPEGGISESECNIAEINEISLVGLGKRILRTETASSFVLSAISVFFC